MLAGSSLSGLALRRQSGLAARCVARERADLTGPEPVRLSSARQAPDSPNRLFRSPSRAGKGNARQNPARLQPNDPRSGPKAGDLTPPGAAHSTPQRQPTFSVGRSVEISSRLFLGLSCLLQVRRSIVLPPRVTHCAAGKDVSRSNRARGALMLRSRCPLRKSLHTPSPARFARPPRVSEFCASCEAECTLSMRRLQGMVSKVVGSWPPIFAPF